MKKIENAYKIFIFSLMLSFSMCPAVFANQPRIVTGTVNLFRAITGWLLLIIPVGAGAFVAFHALQKSMTEDQAVIAEKNKLIKNTIIGAIIAECADGLVTVILSFYS
jgi:uncharacterized membrane protein